MVALLIIKARRAARWYINYVGKMTISLNREEAWTKAREKIRLCLHSFYKNDKILD